MQVTQLFFSVDYYDFTISVLNLNRMRTEIIWWNIVHWNYMEERLFISGTSTCLLITCLFIRKLLAVAGSTCCMQSVTTHNASSAPTHLDDESVMTSVVSNQKSEIVLQKGPDSSESTTTSWVSEPRARADCTALKHMMIVFFLILKGESEMMVGWSSISWELACGRTPQLCTVCRTNHIHRPDCRICNMISFTGTMHCIALHSGILLNSNTIQIYCSNLTSRSAASKIVDYDWSHKFFVFRIKWSHN